MIKLLFIILWSVFHYCTNRFTFLRRNYDIDSMGLLFEHSDRLFIEHDSYVVNEDDLKNMYLFPYIFIVDIFC